MISTGPEGPVILHVILSPGLQAGGPIVVVLGDNNIAHWARRALCNAVILSVERGRRPLFFR